MLSELTDIIVRPFSIILDRSWYLGELSKDWRMAYANPTFRNGEKEDPENYSPVSFTLIPGNVVEQPILKSITRHMKEEKIIRSIQHGFIKGKSHLANLISFYDAMTCLVDEGASVNIFFLDFSKAFDTISCKIPLDKQLMYGMN